MREVLHTIQSPATPYANCQLMAQGGPVKSRMCLIRCDGSLWILHCPSAHLHKYQHVLKNRHGFPWWLVTHTLSSHRTHESALYSAHTNLNTHSWPPSHSQKFEVTSNVDVVILSLRKIACAIWRGACGSPNLLSMWASSTEGGLGTWGTPRVKRHGHGRACTLTGFQQGTPQRLNCWF